MADISRINKKNIDNNRIIIYGDSINGQTIYSYDPENHIVYDQQGNFLSLEIDLDATSMHNLGLYLDCLFEDYYKAVEGFNNKLNADKRSEEKIEWERMW